MRALEYYGAAPTIIVLDKPSRGRRARGSIRRPELQRSYEELAAH